MDAILLTRFVETCFYFTKLLLQPVESQCLINNFRYSGHFEETQADFSF